MTIEHSPWELVSFTAWNGRFEMARCVIRSGNRGVILSCTDGGSVANSEFIDLDGYGVHTTNPTNNFLVNNCTFTNVRLPAGADWSPSYLEVSNCTMESGVVGVGFYGGATGSVTNCTIRDFSNYGIALWNPGIVTIADNTIEQPSAGGMNLGDVNHAVITNNTIMNETGACLYLPYPCDGMVFEGNELYRGSGDFVITNDYWPYTPPTYFHLENNYWGTTDADEIQAHMIDGHVQDEANMYVIFEPFSGGPVPTEAHSWSDVKRLFE